jgi:hypothetical protein
VTGHPDPVLVAGYATGSPDVDDVTAWSIEAHLDTCAACRAVLATAAPAPDRALLERVAAAVTTVIDEAPAPAPGRARLRTRTTWAAVPWLLTTAGVLAVAWAAQRSFPDAPSLVLLLAPVAPLLPVAAAWSRRTDPAWEIVTSTARAGLGLLLHRTLAVLLVVLPLLCAACWGSGAAPALWLLPCLVFTAGSLALGGVVGVPRAAALLALGWCAGVVLPSLAAGRLPAVLHAGSWWLWVVALAVAAAVLAVRSDGHRRLGSRS